MTAHGLQPDGRYLDPRGKQTFAFDHLRKEASAPAAAEVDEEAEPLRIAFDKAVQAYADDHYPAGFSAVYAKGGAIVACIEDHKFQPTNFWNGRWRSEWTLVARFDYFLIQFCAKSRVDHAGLFRFNKASGDLKGVLKVQVHYYEDGNVQLSSHKDVSVKVPVSDDAATAKKALAAIMTAENEYQVCVYICLRCCCYLLCAACCLGVGVSRLLVSFIFSPILSPFLTKKYIFVTRRPSRKTTTPCLRRRSRRCAARSRSQEQRLTGTRF